MLCYIHHPRYALLLHEIVSDIYNLARSHRAVQNGRYIPAGNGGQSTCQVETSSVEHQIAQTQRFGGVNHLHVVFSGVNNGI